MKSLVGFALLLSNFGVLAGSTQLVVHEWGTFTSLQDEAGRALGAINSDDEPVPAFCHDLGRLPITDANNPLPAILQDKGIPRCYPNVTMRLETPVLYFHPPPGAPEPLVVDVKVAWQGGWLTQFYPDAQADEPESLRVLSSVSVGRLAWLGLRIGDHAPGPETTDRVWTAPRAVQAASVTAVSNESERFLFYRGVGHLAAPLRVTRSGALLQLRDQLDSVFTNHLEIHHLWLVESHTNGTCAYRTLEPITLKDGTESVLLSTRAGFRETEFSAANLEHVQAAMRAALMDDGLFRDEAEALLNTWKLSYFRSAGLRLFFLVPRAWTDHYLPLDISVPCRTERVMVGRIELVTPQARELLEKLAEMPVPQEPWAHPQVVGGKTIIRGSMPQDYRRLGRFRNALLLEQERLHPTKSLEAFIRLNGLEAFRPGSRAKADAVHSRQSVVSSP